MKISIIQTPSINSKGVIRIPSDLPLGTAYTSKYLLKDGFDVEVFDIYANAYSKKQVIQGIKKLNCDIIGISAMSTQYSYVKWLSKIIRMYHPKKKVILGGPLASFSPEVVLRNSNVDICVIGEGEITTVDLLKNLEKLKKVKGICYKGSSKIIKNSPRMPIKNLDKIEFPAWDLFDLKIYLNTPSFIEAYGRKNMNIISARGCPFNCNFCSKGFKGVRLRSPENIAEEVKILKKKYKISALAFAEELVMMNKERMHDICDYIKPLNLKWICQGRVNFVDYPLLKHMKEAGCVRVGYGIESGSNRILKNMNKAATTQMAEKALKSTLKARVIPINQMIFGYLGENDETIKETIEFCKRMHIAPPLFNILTPLPGSALYNDCIKKRIITDEDKYLSTIRSTTELSINLTKWSDKELMEKKKYMLKQISKNYSSYRLKHPSIFIKDSLFKIYRLTKYYQHYGIVNASKNIIKQAIKDPSIILEPEYK